MMMVGTPPIYGHLSIGDECISTPSKYLSHLLGRAGKESLDHPISMYDAANDFASLHVDFNVYEVSNSTEAVKRFCSSA